MNVPNYMEYLAALYHSDKYGRKRIYIGKEIMGSFLVGWFLPHDAPYLDQVDKYLMRCVEVSVRYSGMGPDVKKIDGLVEVTTKTCNMITNQQSGLYDRWIIELTEFSSREMRKQRMSG